MICAADKETWAVAVWLASDQTKGWCVDSNGASKPGYNAYPNSAFSAINSISTSYQCL